jgi:hypothetical protein
MKDIIVCVKCHSLGKCNNPVGPCRIPDNCHHRFSQLNSAVLPLRGFTSLRKPDLLGICREMEP